jgi:molybdopterin converting factor subunit 1
LWGWDCRLSLRERACFRGAKADNRGFDIQAFDNAMKIRLKLFAVAKQRLGRDEIEVDLPSGATVTTLRSALIEQHPPLADVIRHVRFAVNSEYASETTAISPTAEIAIIPPVSGG